MDPKNKVQTCVISILLSATCGTLLGVIKLVTSRTHVEHPPFDLECPSWNPFTCMEIRFGETVLGCSHGSVVKKGSRVRGRTRKRRRPEGRLTSLPFLILSRIREVDP